jgi:hypothetical protein
MGFARSFYEELCLAVNDELGLFPIGANQNNFPAGNVLTMHNYVE